MAEKELLVGTLNLWEDFIWEKRRDYIYEVLRHHGFHGGNQRGIILALQEVNIRKTNFLKDLETELHFNPEEVFFFPISVPGKYGLAIVTNLDVIRSGVKIFSSTRRSDYQRGVALMELRHENQPLVFANTHLDFHERTQIQEGLECLRIFRDFIVEGLQLSGGIREELLGSSIYQLRSFTNMLLVGDLNADIFTNLYREFEQAGLIDWTRSLNRKYRYVFEPPIGRQFPFFRSPIKRRLSHTWPPDLRWFYDIHARELQNVPSYSVLQRWMDYIWGCADLIPKRVMLMGTRPKMVKGEKIYISDHLAPMAVF